MKSEDLKCIQQTLLAFVTCSTKGRVYTLQPENFVWILRQAVVIMEHEFCYAIDFLNRKSYSLDMPTYISYTRCVVPGRQSCSQSSDYIHIKTRDPIGPWMLSQYVGIPPRGGRGRGRVHWDVQYRASVC